jgi:6-phosphogluconolactonase
VDAITVVRSGHYLAFHTQRPFLYVTGASGGDVEADPGVVAAFALDPRTGKATYLNQQPTGGVSPCYVSVDGTGHYVLVANYTGGNGVGSVSTFPVVHDGQVGEATDHRQHEGKSIVPDRQGESHAHMIVMDQANKRVLITDLGTDKIMLYNLDFAAGKLIPHDQPYAEVKDGSGPRHLSFTQKHTYLINELSNTVTVFEYDSAFGILRERQTVSTVPDGYGGTSYAADVHVAPSGRFLYGSNRGHDSIAIFAIDAGTGELSPVGWESTRGNWPRSFVIDSSGTFLVVTNQHSDAVVTFWIDPATGRLTPTGHTFAVPAPGCVKTLTLTR